MSEQGKREEKPQDALRQTVYNVRRIAQRIIRNPENAERAAKQIVAETTNALEK